MLRARPDTQSSCWSNWKYFFIGKAWKTNHSINWVGKNNS